MTKTELQELISEGIVTDLTLLDNPDLDKLSKKDLVDMGVVTKVAEAEAILNAKPEETPGDEPGKEPGGEPGGDEEPKDGGDEDPNPANPEEPGDGGNEGSDVNPGEPTDPEGEPEEDNGIVVDENK